MSDMPNNAIPEVIPEAQREKDHGDSAFQYNQATWQFHLPREIMRFGPNWEILNKRHKSGIAEGIQKAPKHIGEPCIIIGSGPSADKVMARLKDWKGGVICSTSHGQTLRYYGVEPDYMIALDSESHAGELGPAKLWKGTKTALVSQPGVDTGLVEYWRWKSYWFRKFEPIADEPRIVYGMVQPLMYSETPEKPGDPPTWLPMQFVMMANYAPMAMFVAKHLGYSPIFMAGIDFGWMDDAHSRFTPYTMEKGDKWVGHPPPIEDMVNNQKKVIGNRPVVADNGGKTSSLQLFYKRNFILGLRLDRQQLWDIGGGGVVTDWEVPRADYNYVIDNHGAGMQHIDMDDMVRRWDKYLAEHDTYVVEWNGGYTFTESDKPFEQFPQAFAQMKARGSKDVDLVKNLRRVAESKGVIVTSDDEKAWMQKMEEYSDPMLNEKKMSEQVYGMRNKMARAKGIIADVLALPSIGVVTNAREWLNHAHEALSE